MKTCDKCLQQNPEEALFCQQCGTPLSTPGPPPALENEQQIWRAFIGPSKALLFSLNNWWSWHRADDYYLEQFRKFTSGGAPRFALTWHWPSFLVDPFLWFLYRKMYLYAVVYAVGPVVSAYATGDFTVGIVWRMMAGVSANYIYYWHVKEHVATIRAKANLDGAAQERLLHDLGGVQPYVIWLGVILHVLLLAMMIMVAREGPPGGGKDKPSRSKPAAVRTLL